MGHLREIQSSWYVCSFGSINMEKISIEDHPIQSIQEKEKTKHYWSFSHDPATVVTDVLLAASSLSALFSWILAALYQDIVIIKGFTSSCLFNRFESIQDEKKKNSTAQLSSNSSRFILSIHSKTADRWMQKYSL